MPAKKKSTGNKKDSRLTRAGVSGYNKPKKHQAIQLSLMQLQPKKETK